MRNRLFKFDRDISQDRGILVGVDEAGRGPGAGDVVVAAVCFREIQEDTMALLKDLNDSKQVKPKVREELYEIIIRNSVYRVCFGSVEEIERENILNTTLRCMRDASIGVIEDISRIEKIEREEELEEGEGEKKGIGKGIGIEIIVDGNRLIPKMGYRQQCIIKGDSKSASIAAASIIAKVTRDRYMEEISKEYPQYNWKKNKGYLTKEHLEAIDEYGITEYHRKKFLEKHFSKQLTLF
jgi:ribonuclease HII